MFKNSKEAANTNHKNRKYSILLLALLFIGVATYGTYAYFTDSKSIDGQLTLTKGQVSLGESHSEWDYKGNTGESEDYTSLKTDDKKLNFENKNISAQSGISFSNVLPGDTFKKTITVSYKGSVDATGTITLNTNKISNKIGYTVLFNNGGENKQLNTDEEINFSAKEEDTKKLTFTLIVHVPFEATEEDFNDKDSRNNDKSDDKNFLEQLQDAITVSVAQQLTETTTSSN